MRVQPQKDRFPEGFWLSIACIVALGCTQTARTVVLPEPEEPGLHARIQLSDWGVTHPSDIGYVDVGILSFLDATKLVVYDVRRQPPKSRLGTQEILSKPPTMANGLFLLSHFNYGNTNALGGTFSAFAKQPSTGRLMLGTGPDNTRSLVFSYLKAPQGFAGFWVHLFDFKTPQRVYLDARETTYLTFSVRGQSGNESLLLQVADRNWETKGDSLPLGALSEFLPSGKIDTTWQRALVPVKRFPLSIEKKEMASVVFVANQEGRGRVFIKDMAFTLLKDVVIPTPPSRISIEKPLRTALWVWETEKIASSHEELETLLTFCKKHHVTDLFLQVPRAGPSRLGNMIRRLHAIGVRVDALDGDPRYALEERHGQVLSMIRNIIEYNNSVEPEARYDGIRYDNEPYLLPTYGGSHKQDVLRQYLKLLKKSYSLCSKAGLSFGVDIPFWFDGKNRFHEPTAEIGGRPLSELVIDTVDNLAIMDYRTKAYGPDGVVAHGMDELIYAKKSGKQIYIGLETVYLPDETIQAFGRDGKGPRLVFDKFDGKAVRVSWLSSNDWERLSDDEQGKHLNVLGRIYQAQAPASKLTFDKWCLTDLSRVIENTQIELNPIQSFIGFAIHSYESYRPWLNRKENVSSASPTVR